ncbi:MAG: DUF302 domain-containing protein [Brevundimonas sp.]|nr:DUF302 domain-containing protein [Brevundimonas sp.]
MKIANSVVPALAGVVVGLIIGIGGIAAAVPYLMINETRSDASVDVTVQRLSNEARARGWSVSGVRPLDRSVKSNGGPSLPAIRLLELCHAKHAGAILDEDRDRRYAAMMPCTVAVYETASGVRIASLNAALLGPLLGGEVGRVMGGQVAGDQKEIIAAAIAGHDQ